MVDILVASALVAAGVTVATRRFSPDHHHAPTSLATRPANSHFVTADADLPCPWCCAPTREDDRRCPSCHQPFG
jgi:hypothetical protein